LLDLRAGLVFMDLRENIKDNFYGYEDTRI